jgi:outer membrane lipoprotein
MRLIASIILAVFLLAGCASVISSKSRKLVDRSVSFTDLLNDPARYNGHFVMLGGGIVTLWNKSNGADELELVQLKINDRGEIVDATVSEGRFFAMSSTFLDPAIYQPGRLVTLVGEVQGTKTVQIGERESVYPVLLIKELHLWKPEELYGPPPLRFGVGVGIGTIIR